MSLAPDLDLASTLDVVVAVARDAGRLVHAAYRHPHTVRHKASAVDLVTEVDLAAEAFLRDALGARFPGFAFLGEEGGATAAAAGVDATWIVDPLDGTTNFAHGHPFFCVSIALEIAGRLVLGVVHAPALGVTWSARLGGGARRNDDPAHVSAVSHLGDALCASGFPYDRRTVADNNTREWSAVIRTAQGVRRCGSAALDLALVADGTYDAYWEKRLNPWDVAAGTLLVAEAGGRVTSLEGADVPPWPEVIVASNGHVHDSLRAVVRGAP